MTFIGALAFGDFEFHPWNAAGLTISLVGSCIYAYDKVTTQLSMKSKMRETLISEPRGSSIRYSPKAVSSSAV